MQKILGRLANCGSPPLVPQGAAFDVIDAASQPAVRAPTVEQNGHITIALLGRPRIGSEGYPPSEIAGRLLSMYRERGDRFLPLLRGPFALAILDIESNQGLIAVDRMGVEKLCWGLNEKEFVFGTSAAETARSLFGAANLNRQAMFDFMLSHMIAAPDTAFTGVSKLLPGTYLSIDHGRVQLGRYWEPRFQHAEKSDISALRERLLPTLRGAVEASEPGPTTGSFLSGGLDSSTVTGLLAETRGRETPAFSVGFGVDKYDELSYARLAAQRFGCAHYEYQVTPKDIVDLVPRIAAAYDEPFGNSSAVPTFCCARLAKSHGVDHLLAGDGGDELFGGNERYTRHRIFELYQSLPRWLRSTLTEPLAAKFDPESSPFPLRKFSSYIRQARVPLPERFESWNLIYREGPARVFAEDFLTSIDTDYQLRRMREVWDSCPSNDLLDRMLWYDWKFTLSDNDLPKVSRMCELAGVRASYPMLDEDLIDLSISVPTSAKIVGTELRRFFKDGLRDFLPIEIINKQKHGFSLPFGVWLKTDKALQELIYGSLDTLKDRSIFNRAFIERVVTEHRQGHASYYGYAIWDLVMLEQWLRQNADSIDVRG